MVTGGTYGSNEGCLPYTFKPCHHPDGQNSTNNMSLCSLNQPTPKCRQKCESSYHTSYQQDKHFGLSASSFKAVEAIQTEIMTNGPVTGVMDTYEDFLSYKTGNYNSGDNF